MIDHPFLKSPDDEQEQRELQATYYGMMAEVDDQLGRIFDWLDETGQADRTLVVFTIRSRRDPRRPLDPAQARLVRPVVPRAADRARPAREFDASRGRVVDAFTEHVDVLPTICELLGTDVPLQCDGRPLTPWLEGDTPDDWRDEVHFEFDFRDPDGALLEEAFGLTLEECALAVLRDEHGKYVQFSGHPALPPIFFDLDADPDADRATSPPIPRTRRRCSTTRNACSRGACSTPNARSPA